jgi:hypothetical protein
VCAASVAVRRFVAKPRNQEGTARTPGARAPAFCHSESVAAGQHHDLRLQSLEAVDDGPGFAEARAS